MRVVDRFVCRREGHAPSVTVAYTTATRMRGTQLAYFTTCKRCGKWYEVLSSARAEAS